jgi:hypothetical protein
MVSFVHPPPPSVINQVTLMLVASYIWILYQQLLDEFNFCLYRPVTNHILHINEFQIYWV